MFHNLKKKVLLNILFFLLSGMSRKNTRNTRNRSKMFKWLQSVLLKSKVKGLIKRLRHERGQTKPHTYTFNSSKEQYFNFNLSRLKRKSKIQRLLRSALTEPAVQIFGCTNNIHPFKANEGKLLYRANKILTFLARSPWERNFNLKGLSG